MGPGSRHAVLGRIDRLFRAGTAVGLSDAQLLERFVVGHDEGAESAFNVLVERHGPMVLAVCRRVLNDPHDAQDAFQATFLVLVRKAGTVRKRESIADWLHGVARRVSARALADLARRRSVERRAVTGSLMAYRPPLPDIDARDEVEYLPHDLRAVVVLCYLEGLTHDQAARRLGWPVGTVRSRLARARTRLRADLTRRGMAPDAALLPMLAFKKLSLPEKLIDATVSAAMLLSARDAGEAGLVSNSAVALTEGVLRTMLVSKFKLTAVALIAVGALTSGAGIYAYQGVPSGARPRAVGASSAPGILPATQASADSSKRSAKELDAYAAQVEQLVRRARQQQAAGQWDEAARDLRKSVELAGEWQAALMNRRTNEKSDPLLPLPTLPANGVPAGSNPLAEITLPAGGVPAGSNPLAEIPLPLGGVPAGLDPLAPIPVPAGGVPGPAGSNPLAPIPLPAGPVKEGFAPVGSTSPSRSAECRLADLESKVNRILQALEKDGHDHAERPKPASPTSSPKRTD
jgi:RNA polymerase sigma factor (sigma-70 family)